MGYFWTGDEIYILESFYSSSTKEELMKLLPNRTYKSIGVKAAKMGLIKDNETKVRIRRIFGENQRGENNPHYGEQYVRRVYPCYVCGIEREFENKFADKIDDGIRKPMCSNECSVIYAREHITSDRTSIEIKMAEELKSRDIKYEEQYRVGIFTADFYLPEYDIIIECDGDYWHNLPEVKTRDKSKNAYIKACGYSLYRFWEHEINTDVGACVDVVLAEINEKEAIA